MKAVFLTEYSSSIGFGHLARCGALADELYKQNFAVEFIIRGSTLSPTLNFDYSLNEWNSSEFIQKINLEKTLLIFDSYLVKQNELNIITRDVIYPISISDSQRNYVEKGLVIIPSAYGFELLQTKKNLYFDYLAGPEYVLFRKEFISNIPLRKKINENVNSVLISLGGFTDVQILNIIINALLHNFNGLKIYIVGNIRNVELLVQNECVKYLNFVNAKKYVSLLKDVDFAVLNGGQSLNEAILLKVPSIAIPTAGNQFNNISFWRGLKACLACDPVGPLPAFEKEFTENLLSIKRPQIRDMVNTLGVKLDGLASERIVRYLLHKFNWQ